MSSRRKAVGSVIAAVVTALLGAGVFVGTLIMYPHGSLRAQNPTPSARFANVEPPSTTVPPGANGIVVEGVDNGCAAATLQDIENATVTLLNQGWEVWTEFTIDICANKPISDYEHDFVSILISVLTNAPGHTSQWLGMMLDEESGYLVPVSDLVSLNGYVATVLGLYTARPTWFATETSSGTGDWSQGDFNAITYGSYPAPAIATDYMVLLTNTFYQSFFGTQNLATWSTVYPPPYNHEVTSVSRVDGTPYSIAVGNFTYYYDNQFCPGSCRKLPSPRDTDGDGCTDQQENGTNPLVGGQRNYLSFWDFFDVWTRPAGNPTGWERNKVVNISDILGVAARFGTAGDPSGDPLSLPPDTGYHAAYDRGVQIGPNPWNRAPADGVINIVDDVLSVASQFGHSCL